MPMRAKELKDAQVRSLEHPGGKQWPVKVAVGGVAGLYIQIQPETHYKSWLFRTRFGSWCVFRKFRDSDFSNYRTPISVITGQ